MIILLILTTSPIHLLNGWGNCNFLVLVVKGLFLGIIYFSIVVAEKVMSLPRNFHPLQGATNCF